jgi:hypothetical protein
MKSTLRTRALRMALFLTVLGVSVLATSEAAHAEDPPPTQSIATDLHSYYGGERASAYFVAVLSVLSVGAGSVLVTRGTDFTSGLGWPLIGLGALEGIGAIIYAFQVGAEIRHYETALAHDPGAYRREELAHIHGTGSRFVFYRLTELGLFLGGVGVASYGFAAGSDTWKGIGVGVASIALPFLIIDTINNGRAVRYEDHLRGFDPSPTVSDARCALPPPSATPFYLSYGGRF